MLTPRQALMVALLSSAAAVACQRSAAAPLATLAGRPITESDFRRHVDTAFPADQAAEIRRSPARRRAALDEYLNHLAIAAKASRLGIDREPRFAKAVELMKIKLLASRLTERNRGRVENLREISPQEVRQFYDRHKGEYLTTPGFTARQVLIYVRGNPAFPDQGLEDARARTRARKARHELRAGASWDVVARRYSDDLATRDKGGLLRDRQFGHFAAEVEQAVRTQPLGKPGEVVKSAFGYHVIQVEARIVDSAPEPFEQVEPLLRQRIEQARATSVRKAIMDPIAREMGLRVTDAGRRDSPLLDETGVAPDAVLAEVAGSKVLESDFRWFLKDAVIASQRAFAFSPPGARQSMLTSYLDLLVLAAKARSLGLDRGAEFLRDADAMKRSLLLEFVEEHDKAGPFCGCKESPEARQEADQRYFARVRAEVGLRFAPASETGQ
jgi:peptidyl-prolyl cis-trans isomerase C